MKQGDSEYIRTLARWHALYIAADGHLSEQENAELDDLDRRLIRAELAAASMPSTIEDVVDDYLFATREAGNLSGAEVWSEGGMNL